jgi:hypothetical protein
MYFEHLRDIIYRVGNDLFYLATKDTPLRPSQEGNRT